MRQPKANDCYRIRRGEWNSVVGDVPPCIKVDAHELVARISGDFSATLATASGITNTDCFRGMLAPASFFTDANVGGGAGSGLTEFLANFVGAAMAGVGIALNDQNSHNRSIAVAIDCIYEMETADTEPFFVGDYVTLASAGGGVDGDNWVRPGTRSLANAIGYVAEQAPKMGHKQHIVCPTDGTLVEVPLLGATPRVAVTLLPSFLHNASFVWALATP